MNVGQCSLANIMEINFQQWSLSFLTCPVFCIFRLGCSIIFADTRAGFLTAVHFLCNIWTHYCPQSIRNSLSELSQMFCTLSSFRRHALDKLTFLGRKKEVVSLKKPCKGTVKPQCNGDIWALTAEYLPGFIFKTLTGRKKVLFSQMTATNSSLLLNFDGRGWHVLQLSMQLEIFLTPHPQSLHGSWQGTDGDPRPLLRGWAHTD